VDTLTGLTNGTAYRFTVAAGQLRRHRPELCGFQLGLPRQGDIQDLPQLSSKKVTYGDEQAEHLSVTVSPQYSGITPTGSVNDQGVGKGTLCRDQAEVWQGLLHAVPQAAQRGHLPSCCRPTEAVRTFKGSDFGQGDTHRRQVMNC